MNGKIFKYKNEIILILTIIITSIPIFYNSLPIDSDLTYHLTRIESLYIGIHDLEIPLRINNLFFNNYGYPVSIFYPNALLVLPACLRFLQINLVTAYKISVIFYLSLTGFSSYFFSNKIFKDKSMALLITIIYILSNYHSTNFFQRGAYAEGLAFIFIPIAIYSIYNLIYEEKAKWYLLAITFTGLILTHLITSLIVLAFTAIIFVIKFKTILNKEKIIAIIKAITATILMTLYFTIPFIINYFKFDWKFKYPWANINQFNFDFLNSFFYKHLVTPTSIYSPPGIGIIPICIILIALINFNKLKKEKMFKIILFTSLSLWIFTLDLKFLESFKNLVSFIQFPFRVLGLLSYCIATLAGYTFKNKSLKIILPVIIIIMSYSYLKIPNYNNVYTNNSMINNSLGYYPNNDYNEFLPALTSVEDIYFKGDYIYTNNNELIFNFSRSNNTSYFEFSNNNLQDTYIDLPLIYYENIQAYLNKHKLKTEANGLTYLRVYLGENESGLITIKYHEPPLYIIADLLSLFSFIAFIYYLKSKINLK